MEREGGLAGRRISIGRGVVLRLFRETSAKTGQNVEETFIDLVRMIRQTQYIEVNTRENEYRRKGPLEFIQRRLQSLTLGSRRKTNCSVDLVNLNLTTRQSCRK